MRIGDEVALQLAQYLRCENKQQYDDLQRGRQLNAEVLLDKKRQDKQSQYQQADKRAFIFAADDGRHQRLMTAFSCGPRCRGAFFLRSIVYPFLRVISIFRYYTTKYEEIQ